MSDFFLLLLRAALIATAVMVVVMVLRAALPSLSKRTRCALWILVAAALILPLLPYQLESNASLVPDRVADGEVLEDMFDGYVGTTITSWEGHGNYQDAVEHGVPIYYDENGGRYTVTGEDGISPPLTLKDTRLPILAVTWLVGMCALLLYAVARYVKLCWDLSPLESADGNVYDGKEVPTPFILGVFAPRIYLPADLDAEERNMVLAHERAHIGRGDHIWKVLGYVLLAVYWFHPLCWVCYRLFCRDIELACDEKVVRDLAPEQRADYSQTLLRCSAPEKFHLSCPLAFGEVGVKERVANILNYKKPAFWVTVVAIVVCIAAAALFLTKPAHTPNKTIDEGTYELFAVQDSSGDFYRTSERFQAAFPQSEIYPSQLKLKDGIITWTVGPQEYSGTYEKDEQDFPVLYHVSFWDMPDEEWTLFYQHDLTIGKKEVPMLQLQGSGSHEVYLYADPGMEALTPGEVPMLFRVLLSAESDDYVDCGVTVSSPTDQLVIHNYDLSPKSFRLLDESGQEVHSGEFGQYGDAYKSVTVMRVTPNAPYRLEIRSDSDRMETARFIVHDGNTSCGGSCIMLQLMPEEVEVVPDEYTIQLLQRIESGETTLFEQCLGEGLVPMWMERYSEVYYDENGVGTIVKGNSMSAVEIMERSEVMNFGLQSDHAIVKNSLAVYDGNGFIQQILYGYEGADKPYEGVFKFHYDGVPTRENVKTSTEWTEGSEPPQPPVPDPESAALLVKMEKGETTMYAANVAEKRYPTYMQPYTEIICDGDLNCTIATGGELTYEEIILRNDILGVGLMGNLLEPNTKITYDLHGFIQNIYYEIPGKPGEYQLSPPTPAQKYGTTERLTYDSYGLELEITGVHELRKETFREPVTDEVFETWEGAVCVVYPGAMATVLNADMTDDGDFSWVFYESNTGEHLPVTDGMAPVLVAEKMDGIGRESVLILRFEVYQGD